jgi:hypothetical protein
MRVMRRMSRMRRMERNEEDEEEDYYWILGRRIVFVVKARQAVRPGETQG